MINSKDQRQGLSNYNLILENVFSLENTPHGINCNFRTAIIRSGSLNRGHFKSLIMIGNEMKLLNDNNVLTMTEREGFSRMRFNRYGFMYGVLYGRG